MHKLMVNIDHVATLREARGINYPDPYMRRVSQKRPAHRASSSISGKTAAT